MIRLLVVVALAGVFGGLLLSCAPPEGARAQFGGDVYDAATGDGRLLRFVVANDESEITVIDMTDGGDVTCASGYVDRFIASTTAPIASGHFDLHLVLAVFGERSEPTSLATAVTVTGDLLASGQIAGILQTARVEDPACDSGPLAWSGELSFNTADVPHGGTRFTGTAAGQAYIEVSVSDDRGFVTEFRVGDVDLTPPSCHDIASSLPPIPGTGVARASLAEPMGGNEFGFVRSFVVAETKPTWTAFVTGAIMSDTQVEGTVRLIEVDYPECDTGVLSWTATAPPPVTPEPTSSPGELPAGGSGPAGGGGGTPLVMALGVAASLIGLGVAGRALLRRR